MEKDIGPFQWTQNPSSFTEAMEHNLSFLSHDACSFADFENKFEKGRLLQPIPQNFQEIICSCTKYLALAYDSI